MGEVISGERSISTDALGLRAAKAAAGLASIGGKRGDTIGFPRRKVVCVPTFRPSLRGKDRRLGGAWAD
jgi:hypothetical protein